MVLFAFPRNAAFERVIPKTKFYERAKPSPALKSKFVSEIAQVIWSYKLAPETINLPGSEGVQELQVFTVTLKSEELDEGVLRAIDRSIPSPILFELQREKEGRTVAAYKRPSAADASSWVVGEYFQSDWVSLESPRTPLPLSLSLGSLYEQFLKSIAPLACRRDEPLAALIERVTLLRAKRAESRRLAARMKAEKQFNRKVELNALLREVDQEIARLSGSGDE
ncbi:MAG: DUF4391 domain-containing protein [Pirellulales bacterium]